ncbi:MAG: DNA polymerase IV, partial [Candidatus Diapherotrites archaeon]|nr:DNA polymerase IV [Candidatus Diapherotrites archaeon]
MAGKKTILHVDLDYFFAQAEEARNPAIKKRPVVVCVYSGRSTGSGAVGTANYLARQLGIKSGMPIAFAKKRASENTVFLPVDMEYYRKVSGKVMETVKKFGDKFEQGGIDEAFIDVSKKTGRSIEKAKQIALRLKKEIFSRQKLTVSVGIGPNKLVAKIACAQNKPDGLTIVEEKKVKQFLEPLSVSEIIGVGYKTQQMLEQMGIRTIGELSQANPL